MRKSSWRQEGQEPDYRFSLANERTFLAWIRTASALLAGSVLLDQFSTRLQPHAIVLVLAISLCAMAAVLCGLAYQRWRANEFAMRQARPLPATPYISMLSISLFAVAAAIASLLLWR